MIIREKIEKFEDLTLIREATFSKNSSGRKWTRADKGGLLSRAVHQ